MVRKDSCKALRVQANTLYKTKAARLATSRPSIWCIFQLVSVQSAYDWVLPTDQARGSEAQIEGVMQRQQGALSMPAWQGEPSVQAHITDLYAYLSARSSGAQGPGQPSR